MSNFVPKQYDKEPVTLQISFEKIKQVDKLASPYHLSRSPFTNQCIDYAMEHMKYGQ